MLDALRASSHSPTGKARGTLPFGFLEQTNLMPRFAKGKRKQSLMA